MTGRLRAPAHAAIPTAAQPQPGRADERSGVPQSAGLDPSAAGEGNPAELVHLLLGRREEGRPETQGHRPAHDRQRTGRAGPPPRRWRDRRACPSALTHAADASRAGCPVRAASAVPDASASRQPRLPHTQARPSGTTTMWPTWPGVAEPAVEQAAVDDDAATHPGRHDHGDVVVAAGRRAYPALAERQRLGVVVHEGGKSGERRQRERRGNDRHPSMFSGRHLVAAGAHRAPAAGAADHQAIARADLRPQTPSTVAASVSHSLSASSGSGGRRRGLHRPVQQGPVEGRRARRPFWCRRCRRPGRDLPREDC